MSQAALSETTDFYRIGASFKLDPQARSNLGQYMTPAPIAGFMASLFTNTSGNLCILDPGAGVGSLTAAFVERLCSTRQKPQSAALMSYEIDPLLLTYLHKTLQNAKLKFLASGIKAEYTLHESDFILSSSNNYEDLFGKLNISFQKFTHVIMNPPYKKINSASAHRTALRHAGVETTNLYTGFMYLAAQQLRNGGEMVAIVPRSFCNGPYFKAFRERFFSMMTLRRIHIFESRVSAFKCDEVLQENIIIHAVKGGRQTDVQITTSSDANFHIDAVSGEYTAHDLSQRSVDHESIINPKDSNCFVHIAANHLEQGIVDRMAKFTSSLKDLGLSVSTGPVVDFRLKAHLSNAVEPGAAPLLYPIHFQGGRLAWPKNTKKPNVIQVTEQSRRWLWNNEGHFVITRRFTSKEERRRIVAYVYSSNLPGPLIGFENHLNVFHVNQRGMSRALARGLSLYLNSSLVDRYFRQFNGHTQVNATDLRSLSYPDREILERIGRRFENKTLAQREIDQVIEGEFDQMSEDIDPIEAQQKIHEALSILTALGMPRGQRNERSALTLLALLHLKPSGTWHDLQMPLSVRPEKG